MPTSDYEALLEILERGCRTSTIHGRHVRRALGGPACNIHYGPEKGLATGSCIVMLIKQPVGVELRFQVYPVTRAPPWVLTAGAKPVPGWNPWRYFKECEGWEDPEYRKDEHLRELMDQLTSADNLIDLAQALHAWIQKHT